MPQCKLCLRKFSGWPAFMGHISQRACPVMILSDTKAPVVNSPQPHDVTPRSDRGLFADRAHAPEEPTDPPTQQANSETSVPIFHDQTLQTLAAQGPRQLTVMAKRVRDNFSLQHCPECYQWVASPSYLSRHACKSHSSYSSIAAQQSAVLQWIKNRGRLQRPCEFCGVWYQARPKAHLQACPVLWICAHLFARHSTLLDAGQTQLPYVSSGRAEPAGSQAGVCSVLSPTPAPNATNPGGVHDARLGTFGGDGPGKGQETERACTPDLPQKWLRSDHKSKGEKGDLGHTAAPTTGKGLGSAAIPAEPAPQTATGSDQAREPAAHSGKPGPAAQDLHRVQRRSHQRESYRQSGAQGSRNWWDQSRNPRRGQRGRDPTDEDLRDLVKHLGRLVLRLEDNQAIASLDTQFLMFMSTAEDAKGWSLTSSLYRVAESWHKQKESDLGSLS